MCETKGFAKTTMYSIFLLLPEEIHVLGLFFIQVFRGRRSGRSIKRIKLRVRSQSCLAPRKKFHQQLVLARVDVLRDPAHRGGATFGGQLVVCGDERFQGGFQLLLRGSRRVLPQLEIGLEGEEQDVLLLLRLLQLFDGAEDGVAEEVRGFGLADGDLGLAILFQLVGLRDDSDGVREGDEEGNGLLGGVVYTAQTQLKQHALAL